MAVVTEIEAYGANDSGSPRRFTVASGVAIVKGTVLKLSDPRTASASDGTGDLFAGIAAADKSATDQSTSIAAWQNGIYEFNASGQVNVGELVQTAKAGTRNMVIAVGPSLVASSQQIVVGYAMKTQTDGLRVQVRVNN